MHVPWIFTALPNIPPMLRIGARIDFLAFSTTLNDFCNRCRHKSDDPWGSYLNSDAGKTVDQGGTKVKRCCDDVRLNVHID